jgi:uncharacterized repeat protein (TIGR01451 family)
MGEKVKRNRLLHGVISGGCRSGPLPRQRGRPDELRLDPENFFGTDVTTDTNRKQQQEVTKMKRTTEKRASVGLRTALAGLGLIAGLMMLSPGEIQASVSGGATIFNEATVTYTTPTIPSKTSKGSTTVIVATQAAAPYATVTPLVQTTGENSTVTYTYSIINRSNGKNDLTVPNPTAAASGVAGATASTLASNTLASMWGGIILSTTDNGAGAGTSTITLPAGTVGAAGVDLVVNTTTVAVVSGTGTVYYYTVTGKTNGTVASSANGGVETNATVTLTPVGATPRLDGTIAPAGTVIGEYRTDVYTQTTSTLTGAPADGTYTTNITVTATDAAAATAAYTTKPADNNQTVTTVKLNPVSVTKTANPLTTVKPGGTITYTVVVTNNSSSDTTAATIADPLSPYVTYTNGTTTLNGGAVADNVGIPKFPLSGAGISIKSPASSGAGIISAGASATIVYQVTVNP